MLGFHVSSLGCTVAFLASGLPEKNASNSRKCPIFPLAWNSNLGERKLQGSQQKPLRLSEKLRVSVTISARFIHPELPGEHDIANKNKISSISPKKIVREDCWLFTSKEWLISPCRFRQLMRELNCNMKISLSEPSTPLGGRNIHGNSPVAHTFSIDLIRFFLGKDPSQFVNLREAGWISKEPTLPRPWG